MKWVIFLFFGLFFSAVGVGIIIFAPKIPLEYSGLSPTGLGTPHSFEVFVAIPPNTLHVNLKAERNLTATVKSPNDTVAKTWQGKEISEEYVLEESGIWTVSVSSEKTTAFNFEIYTTASLFVHPALIYAFGFIVIGILTSFYSNHRRKIERFLKPTYEQNIGGKWIFLIWLPVLGFIASAPSIVPNHPILYLTLLIVTVIAVISSITFVFIKIYITSEGIFLEAPFLNISRLFNINEIEEV